MKKTLFAILTGLAFWSTSACSHLEAQEQGAPPPPIPTQAPDADFVVFEGFEKVEPTEQWELFFGHPMVRNVNRPGVFPVLPDPDKRNGHSVIVLPGGGHLFVSTSNEGFPVAQTLADAGYTVFILKYRTRETPPQPEDFMAFSGKLFRNLGKVRSDDFQPAEDDLKAAISYVESVCPELGCDVGTLSVLGASAGARTIIRAMEDEVNPASYDSLGLVYPPMLDPITAISTAPMFLTIAQDDPLFAQGGFVLPAAWVEAGGELEFHLYNKGGHGFGAQETGLTSENWLGAYVDWLNEQVLGE